MNWVTYVTAIEKNFPGLHKEIIRRVGTTHDKDLYSLRGVVDYVDEFRKMSGCSTNIGRYEDIISWALEMKKKNKLIECVWLL